MRINLLAGLLVASSCFATNIAFTDANILAFNYVLNAGNYYSAATDAEIAFKVNIATNTLSATFYGVASLKVSIDGGAVFTVAPLSAVTPTLTTIKNNLSVGNHNVRIWSAANDSFYSGSAAFVTDGSGTVADTTFSTFYTISAAPFTTYGVLTGNPWGNNTSGYPSWPFAYDGPGLGASSVDMGIQYYGTGACQSIYVYSGLTPGDASWALYQDGTSVGSVNTQTGGGVYQLLSVCGLNASQHLYEWMSYNLLAGPNGVIYVMPSGTLSTVAVTARKAAGIYGDSIVAISNPSSGDTRLAWWAATNANNMNLMRMGKGGQKVVTWGRDNTDVITGGAHGVPTLVIHELGVNDQQAYTVAADITTFQTAVGVELTNMAAGMAAGSRMLWQQILPNTAAQSAQRGAYNAAIVAAVATYNGGSPSVTACTYSTTGWVNTTTDMNGDGLHPILQNASSAQYPFGNPLVGYGKISNRMSPILAAYLPSATSYTQSVTSGTTTLPLPVSVTLTLGGSATWADTISYTSSVSSDVVCLGASCAQGTATLPANTGGATTTLKVYPSTVGTRTLTPANLPDCWVAPGVITVTATANANTYVLLGDQ